MKTRLAVLSAAVLLVIAAGILMNNRRLNVERGDVSISADMRPDDSVVVLRPEQDGVSENKNLIFRGWETALQGEPARDVSHSANALYQDVSGLENVFAIPSVYAKAGETFEVPLSLCGQVSLCAFDLRIYYDASLLRYAGCDEADENLLVNCDAKNGLLYVNFLRTVNVEDEVGLCRLAFQVLTSERHESALHLETVEAVAVDMAGDVTRRDACSVDSILYLNV